MPEYASGFLQITFYSARAEFVGCRDFAFGLGLLSRPGALRIDFRLFRKLKRQIRYVRVPKLEPVEKFCDYRDFS